MKKEKNKRANSYFGFQFNNLIPKSKHSQVTIFIILALILVVAILSIFILKKGPSTQFIDEENPLIYIDSCVRQFTEEAVNLLSENGGDINPEGSVMYKGKNITYLCYTANYYKTCVNQRPLLIEHIENEIKEYINPKVNGCFDSLKTELEKKGYGVEINEMLLSVSLNPKQTVVDIKTNLRLTKNNKYTLFNNFVTKVNTPIYDFAEIAMEIANQESHFCNFENLGFMIIYPEYDIRKERAGDSLIYILKKTKSTEEFKFATRSCAMPAGF